MQQAIAKHNQRNSAVTVMDSLGPDIRRGLSMVAETALADGDPESSALAGFAH
mgnify:CR=1 FL=1